MDRSGISNQQQQYDRNTDNAIAIFSHLNNFSTSIMSPLNCKKNLLTDKNKESLLLDKLRSNFLTSATIYLKCSFCDFNIKFKDIDTATGKNTKFLKINCINCIEFKFEKMIEISASKNFFQTKNLLKYLKNIKKFLKTNF